MAAAAARRTTRGGATPETLGPAAATDRTATDRTATALGATDRAATDRAATALGAGATDRAAIPTDDGGRAVVRLARETARQYQREADRQRPSRLHRLRSICDRRRAANEGSAHRTMSAS